MSELSDKYYSKKELLAIARERQVPEKYFEDFVVFVEKDIQQMTDDAELSDNEIGTAAIDFAIEYFDKYDSEIQMGHSKEWSHVYAVSSDNHSHAFNHAYTAVKESDPEKAKEELKIHCKVMGGDDLYTSHFVFLMENGEALSEPDKQAAIYSAIYKEQIALGKSKIFAHEYADLMAGNEYNEAYCFTYAKCFEGSLSEGKSEKYAQTFAYRMADYYGEEYSFSNYIKYDELDLQHELEIRESCKYLI